jgi:hypothetical protein
MKNKFLITGIVFILFTGLASAQFTADPELEEYRQPDITVNQEVNTVTATFYIENTGGSFANIGDDSWIIEIQPERTSTFSFLLSQAGVSTAQTCDDSKPKNVHKEFVFSSNERKAISLTSPINGEGSLKPGEYSLKGVTVTGCTTGDTAESGVEAVQPYGWGSQVGTFVVEEDTSGTDGTNDGDTPSQDVWIAYSNSQTCVQVAQDNVPTNLQSYETKQSCIENTGAENGLPVLPLAGVTLVIVAGILYWRWDF